MISDGSRPPADPYAALAPIYDEWQERLGSFWTMVLPDLEREIAGRAAAGPIAYLDLGCGTGSLLVGLRERHPDWRLCGLDGSAAMLAEARKKPGADTIEWRLASFHDAVASAFTVAGCFYDGLNHLPDPPALGRALGAVAAALEPGGLFVFDLNNRRGFEAWWQGRQSFVGRGWELTVETSFDAETGVGRGRVQLLGRSGPPVTTEIIERCFAPDEVSAALAAAGLSLERAEPWAFAPGVIAGKTWYVARRP